MVVSLGYDLALVDLLDLQEKKRTGSYIFMEKEKALIETSASPSIPHLLEGMKNLGIAPEELEYVIITHIHLDHSGGLGLFLTSCPNARVIVHPKGARHLADPSRLIASARRVYGDERFDELFDPILPVDAARIVEMEDSGTLQLGERVLTFYHTPGHAAHHLAVHDSKSNGVFTGDVAGIQYALLQENDIDLFMPATSPNQFDPEAMRESMTRILSLQPDRLYFAHYGMTAKPKQAVSMVNDWLDVYLTALNQFDTMEELEQTILQKVQAFLTEKGIDEHHPIYRMIRQDVHVSAQGLLHYKQTKPSS